MRRRKTFVLILVLVLFAIVESKFLFPGMIHLASASPTMIYLDPPTGEYLPRDEFTVTLKVDTVSDMCQWVVTIEWDPALLELVGTPIEGGCLKSFGNPTFCLWAEVSPGIIREWTCARMGDVPGADVPPCPDDLGSMTFRVKDTVEYCTYMDVSITFSDLLDPTGASIPHTVGSGRFHVPPTQYKLTVSSSPMSGVNIYIDGSPSPSGQTPCEFWFDAGTTHSVKAEPTVTVGVGTYAFSRWEGVDWPSIPEIIWENPITVPMDKERALTAIFTAAPVHDLAVTDVYTDPSSPTFGQETTIWVEVENEGDCAEINVPVKAYVDGSQVGSTQYVTLSPGDQSGLSFLWTPDKAKKYSVTGEIGVVPGETDTADNTETISVTVNPVPQPAVTVSTDKETHSPGDTMLINITISNPGPPVDVFFVWYLWLPGLPLPIPIAAIPLHLPAGYDQTFTIPLPVGDWGGTGFDAYWVVALLDPSSWAVIDLDYCYWIYQPTAGPPTTPEAFAEKVAEAAEKDSPSIP